jgi:hypothetical protein
MPYNTGDVVRVPNHKAFGRGRARVQSVLEHKPVAPDFQEYIVEFDKFDSERFRFGLCREFEMLPDLPPIEANEE